MVIDALTMITKGLPISENFLLDHVSTGAYHFVMGKWSPKFTSVLKVNGGNSGIQGGNNGGGMPLWKLGRGLQLGAQGILEPLLKEFGGDLIIRAASIAGAGSGSVRGGLDIQVNGFQNNMMNMMPDFQKILTKSSGLTLFSGGPSSFSRVFFDEVSTSLGEARIPDMKTFDMVTGSLMDGLAQVKGFI